MLRPYLENPRNGDSSKKKLRPVNPPTAFILSYPMHLWWKLFSGSTCQNSQWSLYAAFPEGCKTRTSCWLQHTKRNPLHIIFVGQNPHSANLSTLHQLIASSLNPCKFHLQRYVAKGTQNDQSGIDILSLLRIRHGLRGIRILFFSLLGKLIHTAGSECRMFPFSDSNKLQLMASRSPPSHSVS